MQPRFRVPQKAELIIDEKGFQLNRFFRFLGELSAGSWKKRYIADTDGSGDFTISSDPAIVSLKRGWAIPYLTDDRIWNVDFCFVYTVASALRTRVDLTLPLVFSNADAAYFQPCIGQQKTTDPGAASCVCLPNDSDIVLLHASETTDAYVFKGNGIELKQKPDWVE